MTPSNERGIRVGAGRIARHFCFIPGCDNQAYYTLNLRLRRADTTAVWAPSTDAYVCDEHALCGAELRIRWEPTTTQKVDVWTYAVKDGVVGEKNRRTLEIRQPDVETPDDQMPSDDLADWR